MKVVKLSDRSETVPFTALEALEGALKSSFNKSQVLIVIYDDGSNEYEFWQGGGSSVERLLWHTEQFKQAILDGRLVD